VFLAVCRLSTSSLPVYLGQARPEKAPSLARHLHRGFSRYRRPHGKLPPRRKPSFTNGVALKAETNPAGLISRSVQVWQYAPGQSFPITGVARWEEFAPITTV
jgi:hypothetical protein